MAQQSNISIETLHAMFDNIRAETSWNIEGEMLWGYFFASLGRQELEQIASKLEMSGYRLVGIRELERDSPDDEQKWQLHVERVEAHTVETLNSRNIEFESLADHHVDVIYDGMDVGPASAFPTNPPSE